MASSAFVLKNIDFEDVFRKYNTKPQKKSLKREMDGTIREMMEQYTEIRRESYERSVSSLPPIGHLLHEDGKTEGSSTFSDPSDNPVKIWTWAFDLTTGKEIPTHTTKACLWDKHSFNSCVWSLPLVYKRVCTHQKEKGSKHVEYFGCEGIFCSPECRYAFLMDKLKSACNHTKYKFCLTLITLYDLRIFGKLIECEEAPDWLLLKPFGGHLSVPEFRQIKSRLSYQKLINHQNLIMLHHSAYYEERRD